MRHPGVHWYDREGKEITDIQEVEAKLRDPSYRQIKKTVLKNKRWVSTVWLGLDHGYEGRKLIFETLVFNPGSMNEIDGDRYSSEAGALKGHARLVRVWARKPTTKKPRAKARRGKS